MRRDKALQFLGVFILYAALSVGAGAAPTRKLIATIPRCFGSPGPNDIVIVVKDEMVEVDVTSAGRNMWAGDWRAQGSRKFNADKDAASLRLFGRRTDCRKPTRKMLKDQQVWTIQPDEYFADYTFVCNDLDAQKVTVFTDPRIKVGYVRRMNAVEDDPFSAPCLEYAYMRGEIDPINVTSVRLERESLVLQLLWEGDKGNPNAPGLTLMSGDKKGFHPTVVKFATGDHGKLVLKLDAILDVLREQHLSDQEISYLSDRLRRVKFKVLTLTGSRE